MALPQTKRVAIVGGGFTGITSFWALQNSSYDVHLFEASPAIGGHMKTLTFEKDGNQVEVDMELPSFNPKACPNLVSLLSYLEIPTSAIPFSFSVTDGTSMFRWCSSILKSILLYPLMICNKGVCRIVLDVVCLRYLAVDELADGIRASKAHEAGDLTESYLSEEGYSDNFRDKYLAPLLSMLWRTNAGRFLARLPTKALAQCLSDHQLICADGIAPEWRRIGPGVRFMIEVMTRDFPRERVHLRAKVNEITRHSKSQYGLVTSGGQETIFDHVILTVDGPEILRLLGSTASTDEKEVLECLGVTKNIAILHSDYFHNTNKSSDCNYVIASREQHKTDSVAPKSCLKYNINTLQEIPVSLFGHISITFNPLTAPHPSLVQGIWEFTEPEPTAATLHAQAHLPSIQNKRGISYGFCWTGRGVLEDAITSGLRIATEDLGADVPFDVEIHPQPLASKEFLSRRMGLKENLIRTMLRVIRIFITVFEISFIALGHLQAQASKVRARRNFSRTIKSS